MILLVHLLFGAAMGSVIKIVPLAIILSFLGHYFLDFLPHIEYNIENLKEKQWRKKLLAFSKISLDLCLGLLFILIFSKNQIIIYICAFFSILPDGLTILNFHIPSKILKIHSNFHNKKIHYFTNKKISNFWRFSYQVLIVVISIILLKS